MAVTTTKSLTLQLALDQADPDKVGDALQKVKLGTMLAPLKRTFSALSAASAMDLTALDASGETTGTANPNRLPALLIKTLRVTASGTAGSLGAYIVTDSGGTAIVPPGGANAAVGVALLSDDGKTLTFPNTITAFVVEYVPRAATDPSTAFATI
jgi:hypothetical protein